MHIMVFGLPKIDKHASTLGMHTSPLVILISPLSYIYIQKNREVLDDTLSYTLSVPIQMCRVWIITLKLRD